MNVPPHICTHCCGEGEVWLQIFEWDDPGDYETCPKCYGTGYTQDRDMWIAVYNSDHSAYAPDSVRELARKVHS